MARLDGVRVLVVEDERLVVTLLEEMLKFAGCVIVGRAKRVAQALEAVRDESFDVALLDVNLAGEHVYPVAEALAVRGLPFVFMTGYDPAMLPAKYSGWPAVGKPFTWLELIDKLADALRQPRIG